eukprot:CAMPEP_0197232786 /NCGR_PEP_ID=MMETSP1429-20130617/1029_1 /TAXON_ID=49237 /ORGANISM="Chaetoceros  sp., Strain UNC1202" /LENGTH=150 /DNA_ID=CAMNT_0042690917 /DNA_START=31 /DNA_END=483 /DNA_ORIENTATION=+
MSLEQLNQIKQTQESRLQAITQHYATLRASSSRFSSASSALSQIGPSCESNDIMIPLTESLYVPGKIKDTNKIMVELGTGYYVEKNVKDAQAFLERKSKLVDVNSENVMEAISATRRNVESVNIAMQGKMMEIRARQEGMRQRAADESSS